MECFIAMPTTLQEVETATQTFMITGFLNVLWRCPDLEKEEKRADYYSPDHKQDL